LRTLRAGAAHTLVGGHRANAVCCVIFVRTRHACLVAAPVLVRAAATRLACIASQKRAPAAERFKHGSFACKDVLSVVQAVQLPGRRVFVLRKKDGIGNYDQSFVHGGEVLDG
jgi:hypothetical protein